MARILVTEAVDPAALSAFDGIIDVRSPGEFAQDHLPGAINLPVLGDAERAEVGTIYVQESRFKANRIGAAYVAANIARHLEGALADMPPEYRPLIYCWRGGARSNGMATIVSQIGWRTTVLTGGYRTYRRWVSQQLYDTEPAWRLVLLDGGTGSGKTEMLGRLARRGLQVLDLEGLAGHRGSLFGGFRGQAQPSQKLFESRLLAALSALDPARPVVVEAESSKIGDRMVPPALWQAMAAAPRIELTAGQPERAAYLAATYGEVLESDLEVAFARLPTYPGQKRLEDWRRLVADGAYAELAQALIELHYDPAYRRSGKKETRVSLGGVAMGDLSTARQEEAADQIALLVAGSLDDLVLGPRA